MDEEDLKSFRELLDLCYKPGGRVVWFDVKQVLETAYRMGYEKGRDDTEELMYKSERA